MAPPKKSSGAIHVMFMLVASPYACGVFKTNKLWDKLQPEISVHVLQISYSRKYDLCITRCTIKVENALFKWKLRMLLISEN